MALAAAADGDGEAPPSGLVAYACQDQDIVDQVMEIAFEPRSECTWEAEGNLDKQDLHFQAREFQSEILSLQANSILCSLDVQSESEEFRYDNDLLVTLDNYVLLSSNAQTLLPAEEGPDEENQDELKEEEEIIEAQSPDAENLNDRRDKWQSALSKRQKIIAATKLKSRKLQHKI